MEGTCEWQESFIEPQTLVITVKKHMAMNNYLKLNSHMFKSRIV